MSHEAQVSPTTQLGPDITQLTSTPLPLWQMLVASCMAAPWVFTPSSSHFRLASYHAHSSLPVPLAFSRNPVGPSGPHHCPVAVKVAHHFLGPSEDSIMSVTANRGQPPWPVLTLSPHLSLLFPNPSSCLCIFICDGKNLQDPEAEGATHGRCHRLFIMSLVRKVSQKCSQSLSEELVAK